MALLLQGWNTEAGREAIISGAVDIIVSLALTMLLSYLAHHHIVKPAIERHHRREREAERRHAEQMAAYTKIHRHLGIGEE